MYIIIKIAHFVIQLLPAKFLVRFIHILLVTIGYRKQVINNNFNSTIESGLSNDTFGTFYKKCLFNIAKIMVEILKFRSPRSSSLSYLNIPELEAKCNANNGLILMASHYGNWELACINLPLHTSLPCYGVYKPLKNNILDKELLTLRSRFGLNLIPMNAIARSIATNYNNAIPAIYILIADQNPRSVQSVVWTKFLGIPTAYSNGLLKFQSKYNFPIAYMKTTPEETIFNYSIEFEFPSSVESKNGIEWYSQRLEKQIKEAPQFWLWSHKRWKRKPKQ